MWMAFFNMVIPAAAYYQFYYSVKDSVSENRNALMYVMNMHLGLWAPVLLFSILPGAIPAFYLQYISSNFNPMAYIFGAAALANMYYRDKDSTSKWLFWGYFFWAQFARYEEKMRGTFAMYYLNPKIDTLDAQLHPSIQYTLGWRDHRYRYYHYFPQNTPVFDV